jgi:FMN phosphatase YigB (HAD superfamily)
MVGDHPYEDLEGARAAGLWTCGIGDGIRRYYPRQEWVIDHVRQLPEVLACSTFAR